MTADAPDDPMGLTGRKPSVTQATVWLRSTATYSPFDQVDTADLTGLPGAVPGGPGVASSYRYDGTGRLTSTTDTVDGGGPVQLGFFAGDLVASLSQTVGTTRTATFALDAAGRRSTRTDTTTGTNPAPTGVTVNHYDDDTDNPDWTIDPAGTWTRNLNGFSDLAATAVSSSNPGTAGLTLQLANLHGDVTATVAANATSPTAQQITQNTEYGTPRPPPAPGSQLPKYGYLGTKQRDTSTPGGLTLMGVRLYQPTLGRFLSVDPVQGGSANDYDYDTADSVNCTDLDGRFGWRRWIKRAVVVASVVGALACGASVVCGVAVGAAAGVAAYSSDNAFSSRWSWGGAAIAEAVDGIGGGSWGGAAKAAGWRFGSNAGRGLGVRFSSAGGRGTDFLWNGSRKFAIHSHGLPGSRLGASLHYHRGPGIGRHRPWGGW